MDKSHRQLLELYRSSLWQRRADEALFDASTDWTEIYRLAKEQSILGLVYDAVDAMHSLPPEKRPDRILLLKWYGVVAAMESRYEQQVRTLRLLYQRFADQKPILLKGLGVAQNYPNPKHRQLGDIDLFLPRQTEASVAELLRERGCEEMGKATDKHLEVMMDSVSVEFHWRMATLINPFRGGRFASVVEGAVAQARLSQVGGVEVFRLPVEFDAVYLLLHQMNHLLDRGLGLRQLGDWALFLHRYRCDIDPKRLACVLRSLGLLEGWKLFECYCLNYLEMPSETAFFCDDSFLKKAEKMNSFLFECGNFGHHHEGWKNRPSDFWRRKRESFFVNLKLHRRTFEILPAESILAFVFGYLPSVVRRLK